MQQQPTKCTRRIRSTAMLLNLDTNCLKTMLTFLCCTLRAVRSGVVEQRERSRCTRWEVNRNGLVLSECNQNCRRSTSR